MVVVHPDADFLNDIAGKLREVYERQFMVYMCFFTPVGSIRCPYNRWIDFAISLGGKISILLLINAVSFEIHLV